MICVFLQNFLVYQSVDFIF